MYHIPPVLLGARSQCCPLVAQALVFTGQPCFSIAVWGCAHLLYPSCVPVLPCLLACRVPCPSVLVQAACHMATMSQCHHFIRGVGLLQTCDVSGHLLVAMTHLLTHRLLSSTYPHCQRHVCSPACHVPCATVLCWGGLGSPGCMQAESQLCQVAAPALIWQPFSRATIWGSGFSF